MDTTQKLENIEDNGSCRIADAANTYDWALTIIESKGYKIFLYPDRREGYYGDFWAIKGNREFIGDDPLRLLGVICLWETLGDNWQTQDRLSCKNCIGRLAKKHSQTARKKLKTWQMLIFQGWLPNTESSSKVLAL
ncbi:MAG TPA: hypothetical protein VK325_06200 [Pseudoxanthomonas sp.]|nr:hypothetical protein [Pseudoxanthomonas sp.]